MATAVISETDTEIFYPDNDGQPMADNTTQFRWITVIYHNLAWLLAQDPQVFIAGDLLWYPVEGQNQLRQPPDVMVVFGVHKGDRGSYQQWKEHQIAPQVVFEILSPGNTPKEMARKWAFYNRYGVEEYYLYDPDKNRLTAWLRSEMELEMIEEVNGWTSPRLGIQFRMATETLRLFRPDGQPFMDYVTVQQQLKQAEEQLEQERQIKAVLSGQLEQERQRANRLEQLLREAGIDPNAL